MLRIAISLMLVAPVSVSAQGALQISKIAELSSIQAPVTPSMSAYVARLGEGRFVVSYRYMQPPQIVHYDSTGKFLSTYNRYGEGPGELDPRREALIAVARDTLYLFQRNRVTRLDSRLQPVGSEALPFSPFTHALVLSDGSIAADYLSEGQSRFAVLDSGRNARAQGSASRGGFLFSVRDAGGVWILSAYDSVLTAYSATGSRLSNIRIARPLTKVQDTTAGRPFHVDLVPMGRGYLMLITSIPQPGTALVETRPDERVYPARDDVSAVRDAIVTIVNAQTGAVEAIGSSPRALRVVAGASDLVYATRAIEDGHVVIDVFRITWNR